jgi:hypothetical protein
MKIFGYDYQSIGGVLREPSGVWVISEKCNSSHWLDTFSIAEKKR